MLSNTIGTSTRLKYVDYPAPWTIGLFYVLIPYPKETLNIAAWFKPLSYEVHGVFVKSI